MIIDLFFVVKLSIPDSQTLAVARCMIMGSSTRSYLTIKSSKINRELSPCPQSHCVRLLIMRINLHVYVIETHVDRTLKICMGWAQNLGFTGEIYT